MIIKLTEAFIANRLQCPPGKKRAEVCDDGTGMYIELRSVSPGQGTYYLRYKDGKGKTCHQRIGKTTEISLTDARKQAKTLKAEIELGADPRGEEKARLAVITFDDFFKDHYLPYVKPRKRSWDRDEELYRLRISKKFGSKRLNQVTRQQIQTFHAEVLNEGLAPATANHHIKLIRRMLNLAVEWSMLEKSPANRIPMIFEDNKQERYMNDAQLARFLEVLKTNPCRTVSMLLLWLLSTGCRLGEARACTFSQINPDKKIWRIPGAITKGKKTRVVPLNQTAMSVFLEQKNSCGEFPHLFTNPRTRTGYVNIDKTFQKIKRLSRNLDLRIHDLRHQAASNLINSGSSLYIVQQILGHSDPSVTQRYAHLSMKSLHEASANASGIISRAMQSGSPAANEAS